MSFESLTNRGEYLSAHYIEAVLPATLKTGLLKRWAEEEKDGRRTPRIELRALRRVYFAAKAELADTELFGAERLRKLHAEILTALGFEPHPQVITVERAGRQCAEFLASEWIEVILGQVLNSRTEYFRARRPGRGRRLSREERDRVWQLTERFTKWLDDQGVWTWRQVAGRAARLEMDRAARIEESSEENSGSQPRYRYRHVVVDEAQDLSAAHWKMLRAMVAPAPADMFLVGDSHQRIYDNHVTLASLGINIRGRSSRLTLSYRTTRQILAAALEIMSGEVYDDLTRSAISENVNETGRCSSSRQPERGTNSRCSGTAPRARSSPVGWCSRKRLTWKSVQNELARSLALLHKDVGARGVWLIQATALAVGIAGSV
jgi:AAA domain